jgi:hypothetical protein
VQANDTFFNRVKEVESLQAFLAGSPSNVIVLLGPPSCGKSGARACLGGWCLGADHVVQRCSGS